MLITYDKETCNESYMEWAAMMFDSGFYVSYNWVMQELHVSRNWIHDFIQTAVHHVKYSAKAKAALGIDDSSMVYFHAQELNDWLRDTAVFTRQTRVIDLATYASAEDIEAAQEAAGKQVGMSGKRQLYGFVDPAILAELGLNLTNVGDRNRSIYPAHSVAKFDWMEAPKVHPADFSSTELAYRKAFRHGLAKITICGKTIFVPDPAQATDLQYPMTVAL